MSRQNKSPPVQSSMFDAFAQAEQEAATAHLPATMEDGVPYLLALFKRLDDAIRAGDGDAVEALEKEAEDLAIKLNGGTNFGMCVDDGAAHVLEQRTHAEPGQQPLWGQQGEFDIDINGTRVHIEMDGIYGTCFPGFSIHAIDYDKPFLSETGYRSFLGYGGWFTAGATVESYVRNTLEQYIADKKNGMKGKLVAIKPEYVERHNAPTTEEEPVP